MKGFGIFGAYVFVLFAAMPGFAAQGPLPTPTSEDATMAKMRFERGMAHFRLDEFKAAIEQWEEAFRLKPDPAFLYNIAQAYRLSKQPGKALAFYRKYLKMSPKVANRSEVERHIAGLEKQLEEGPATASKASTEPTAEPSPPVKPPAATAPPVWEASVAPPVTTTPAGVDLTAAATPPAESPVYTKAWFWGVVGGVVVVAAVVAVVVVTRNHGTGVRELPEVQF